MNAQDVIGLIKSYKDETEKQVEEAADKFINDVIEQIGNIYEYNKTQWMILSMNSIVGININSINLEAKKIDFEIGSWYFLPKEEPVESHDWKTFDSHLQSGECKKICNYDDMYEIYAVVLPFVKALEKRGFKMYTTNEESCELIASFEI